MTFIRPNEHKNILRAVFVLGGVLLAAEVAFVILFYNKTVNLSAAISKATALEHQIETQNAILQQKAITAIDGSALSQEPYRSLVEEKQPEYFNSQSNKWVAASHY